MESPYKNIKKGMFKIKVQSYFNNSWYLRHLGLLESPISISPFTKNPTNIKILSWNESAENFTMKINQNEYGGELQANMQR